MEDKSDRAIKLIDTITEKYHISQKDFAVQIGYKGQGNISPIRARTTFFNKNALNLLEKQYQVNTDWLLTGEGEMFLKKEPEASYTDVIDLNQPETTVSDYVTGKKLRVLATTTDNAGKENIILVPAHAAAGYAEIYNNPVELSKLPTFNIPNNKFRGGTFRAFESKGESMLPTVMPGSILIGSYIDDWTRIINDHVYMVVSKEGIVVKRLLNRISERRQLVLQSDNRDYYTNQIDIEDVLEVWKLAGEIRFLFNKTTDMIADQLADLTAEFIELKTDYYNNKIK